MKRMVLITTLACASIPLSAQEAPESGAELIERGLSLFFQGLADEMDPAIDEFRRLGTEIGPELRALLLAWGGGLIKLAEQIDDFDHYDEPEVLENGDIIIRRMPSAPPLAVTYEVDL